MNNKYSFVDKLYLAYWIVRTKLIDKRVRLFRFPLVIRGRQYIDFGDNLTTGVGCRFDCFPGTAPDAIKIKFGRNVQINDYVHMVGMESIEVGDNVLMASHIFISDNSHGSYKGDEQDSDPTVAPTKRLYPTAPVKIGNNSWIGEGSIIMPGVVIGEGCIIGAHSVVNKSIPAWTIAVGSPAKVIKKWNKDKQRWVKI